MGSGSKKQASVKNALVQYVSLADITPYPSVMLWDRAPPRQLPRTRFLPPWAMTVSATHTLIAVSHLLAAERSDCHE